MSPIEHVKTYINLGKYMVYLHLIQEHVFTFASQAVAQNVDGSTR